MRRTYSYSQNKGVLLEPYEAKVSRTVLRGEGSRKGADLLDNLNNKEGGN
jgi:hypothetical protein